MDCSLSGFFVHGVLQALLRDLPNLGLKPRSPTLQADSLPTEHQGSLKILEWVAYPFFRGSSLPKNQTGVSCTVGWFFTRWATREAHLCTCIYTNKGTACEQKQLYRESSLEAMSPSSHHLSHPHHPYYVLKTPNANCTVFYSFALGTYYKSLDTQ